VLTMHCGGPRSTVGGVLDEGTRPVRARLAAHQPPARTAARGASLRSPSGLTGRDTAATPALACNPNQTTDSHTRWTNERGPSTMTTYDGDAGAPKTPSAHRSKALARDAGAAAAAGREAGPNRGAKPNNFLRIAAETPNKAAGAPRAR
jgi:hypothetical protein